MNINVSDSITVTQSVYALPIDYLQPALPTYDGQGGWLFNSIDTQIITKSNGWNPGTTEINNELQELKNKGAKVVALAIPYDNLAKWQLWLPLVRAKGLTPYFRCQWDEWEGVNGVGNISTSTSLTSSGTKATCVTQTAHGLQSGDTVSMNGMNETTYRGEFPVEVSDTTTFSYYMSSSAPTPATGNIGWRYGRQTYLRKTKKFIEDNPSFFQAGDILALNVESQQAANSGCQFFTPGTTTFNYTLYNQFLKDLVSYANAALSTIGLSHLVYTFPISFGLSNLNLAGQTLDSGDQGNSNGLGDSDITTYFAGILSIDHYLSDTYFDTDLYGTKYASDLEKIHTAFPNARLMISEWGHHTTTNTSDAEQDNVYADVVTTALQAKSYILGVNFWNHLGQTSSSLWTDNSGTIISGGRLATRQVLRAFNSSNAAFSIGTLLSTISQSISVTESVSVSAPFVTVPQINVSDSISVLDLVRYYQDTVYVSENINLQILTFSLLAKVSDNVSVTDIIPSFTGELINTLDPVSLNPINLVTVSDNITLSESKLLSGVPNPSVSDNISLSEAYLVTLFTDFNITVFQSVAVSEAKTTALANISINVSDNLTLSESLNSLLVNFDKSISVSEPILAFENYVVLKNLNTDLSISDNVSVTDSLTNLFIGNSLVSLSVSDSITLIEVPQISRISPTSWSKATRPHPTDWVGNSTNGTDWTADPLNEGDT